MTFLQIPTDGAVTEKQALALAKKRWKIYLHDTWTGDGESDGVEWQGDHGTREQRTWEQLNSAARRQRISERLNNA